MTDGCICGAQGSVNIPIVNSVRKYDPEQKKKVTTKSPNDDFIKQVRFARCMAARSDVCAPIKNAMHAVMGLLAVRCSRLGPDRNGLCLSSNCMKSHLQMERSNTNS